MVLGELVSEGKHLYIDVVTHTPPLAAWISGWIDALFGRSVLARHILAVIILFFQVSFFTIILINNRAHHENTYLPGFIFGVLIFLSFDLISFSYDLLASTLLLFAINNLLKEVEFRIQRDVIIFNLGLYIGLSTLIVFSYVVFLPGVIIILVIFTRTSVRKILMLLFGFTLPHAFVWLIFYMRNSQEALIQYYYFGNFYAPAGTELTVKAIFILLAVPLAFFAFSLIMMSREARLTKYQSQLSQIMFLWILLSVVQVIVSPDLTPATFITLIPPLSYYISHYIILIRRRHLAELTAWAFLIAIFSVFFLARYDKIRAVDFSPLFVRSGTTEIKNRKVLTLAEDWGVYLNNQMATGFYSWPLSRTIFSQPDYYENVLIIDRLFADDPPEMIIDPEHLMDLVFKRIPRLRNQYSLTGNVYLINN
jgi:hypothetical protein